MVHPIPHDSRGGYPFALWEHQALYLLTPECWALKAWADMAPELEELKVMDQANFKGRTGPVLLAKGCSMVSPRSRKDREPGNSCGLGIPEILVNSVR